MLKNKDFYICNELIVQIIKTIILKIIIQLCLATHLYNSTIYDTALL